MKKILRMILLAMIIATIMAFSSHASAIPEPVTESETTVTQTATDAIAEWIGTNSAEIMSGLTVVASLVIAYIFKRGLLPVVSASLSKINDKTATAASALTAVINQSASTLDAITKRFTALSDTVQVQQAESAKTSAIYNTIMQSQVDMIASLLLNLNISVDQRAAITDQVAAMKAKISKLTEE